MIFGHAKNSKKNAGRQKRCSARRNAEAGGEDPRRGTRSDQGQNLGKSFGQEARAGRELEELEARLARRSPEGRRIASRIPPGQVERSCWKAR